MTTAPRITANQTRTLLSLSPSVYSREILEKGTPELVHLLLKGGVSLRNAFQLTRLPRSIQKGLVLSGSEATRLAARQIQKTHPDPLYTLDHALISSEALEFTGKPAVGFVQTFLDSIDATNSMRDVFASVQKTLEESRRLTCKTLTLSSPCSRMTLAG